MQETVAEKIIDKQETELSAFASWVLNHDDNLWFNVLYIGLAVVLSILLGLFWLVLVVAVHAFIELYRQALLGRSFGSAILETIWEIKLDIGLIIFAFWLGIYLDFIFGIAGLSAGARAAANVGGRAAQTGARVAVWQRFIRGFFITLDDVGLAFKALGRKKGKKTTSDIVDEVLLDSFQEQASASESTSWRGKYTVGDWLAIAFCGIFLLLILLAPLLTDKSTSEVLMIIVEDLHPFPK